MLQAGDAEFQSRLLLPRNVTLHGEQSRQAAAQIAEWLAAVWNGLAYDALADGVLLFGHAQAL